MSGFFTSIMDPLFGDGGVDKSGAFQNISDIGEAYSAKLLDLMGPGGVEGSKRFGLLTNALKDEVGIAARGTANEMSESFLRSGSFDSGARMDALVGIKRGEIAALTKGTVGILQFLENQTFSAVFPYLQGASNEKMSLNQFGLQKRGQDLQFVTERWNSADDMVTEMFSMGGM